MRTTISIAALVLLLAQAACHSPPRHPIPSPQASGLSTAECPVCDKEGDLACLNVMIRDGTPTCVWNGSRSWFCSDDCRQEFLANPQRYAKD